MVYALLGLFFLAIVFGSSGLAGAWGRVVARGSVEYFGIFAYVFPFYLVFVLFLIRQASLRALELLLASLLTFLALLLGQALVSAHGLVGKALLEVFGGYVGVVGVWLISFGFVLYALFIIAPTQFKATAQNLYTHLLQTPSNLRAWTHKKIQAHPKPPRFTSPPPSSLSFKVKVTPYHPPIQSTQNNLAQSTQNYGVELATKTPTPSAPIGAYMDLLQQRRFLQSSETLKESSVSQTAPQDSFENFPQNIFTLPSINLLNPPSPPKHTPDQIQAQKQNLLAKLRMFKIEGEIVRICVGPVVSTFEFRPATHIKVSKIMGLSDDLAMALCAQSMRIHAPIQGKDVMGFEIARDKSDPICLREILEDSTFNQTPCKLALALGKDVYGKGFVLDLTTLPHLLIAGTTGSGKSVGLHTMLLSLLYQHTPASLRLMLVDPKRVEFSAYTDIPHLITPILTDPSQAINALKNAMQEMERRYTYMGDLRVKNLEGYNAKSVDKLPFLVIVIDELADLMMVGGKEVEAPIIRIAQMGRACGIHLIIATQRPSVDVLTGLIKTNLPSRLSFRVGSKIDSRIILDSDGAQNLLGRGDMLLMQNNYLQRLHAPYTTEEEIDKVADFLRSQQVAHYDPNFAQ
ncbi:DNA translocase FtsK [Helicobacter cynogastricus]|uniref:DNA translocase FtsK n=1 Tax=Helicobacter cynogastricus TaxID=329937 RepID=UPI001F3CC7C6|nr:DNA translocase FtsK [Helicobacter cynogastricus]